MTRTGSAAARALVAAAIGLAVAAPGRAAAQEVEFYQTVDREEIGADETVRLTVVAANAPEEARIQLPDPADFEILSRSQSTEMSYHVSASGAVLKRVTRWVLVLRPKRVGTLTIPSSLLVAGGRNHRADAVKVTVTTRPPARPAPDPMAPAPLIGDAADDGPQRVRIPRSDSDLFLRSLVDATEVFVGEQVTLSVYVFSRVDLSSVDTLNMPKLEGFWTEEIDSPSQLAGEQRVIDGVPYRAYLLRRRALFPVKPGKIRIEPAEADVTTGFLFANRRVRRRGNAVEITVKPLPPGKPRHFASSNVGGWRLSTEVSQTQVELGQPITVRVILEGRGNLRNVSMPPLEVPPGLRAYDPTTADRPQVSRGKLGGRRTQEYLVMPQKTGTFTLPALEFPYFDPVLERYEVSRTDPITVTVTAAGGETGPVATSAPPPDAAKNVLAAAGLRPLRYQADFERGRPPVWRRAFFGPAVAAPPLVFFAVLLGGVLRQRLGREDPEAARRRRVRAARLRLATAERLKAGADADAFYAEVEKAVLTFLEAKLQVPVAGLTREALDARMAEAGVAEEKRQRILSVLEQCDTARYAPGGGEAARSQILDDAAAAMGGWR